MADGSKVPEVRLRPVTDQDFDVFFAFEADPVAAAMAAFPSRDKEAFAAHWARVSANETALRRAIVADGVVAGNIGSWDQEGERLLGYWIGREHWGRGIATEALAQFLRLDVTRPLLAHVASHNAGSARVLEKCSFQRGPAREAAAPPADDDIEELIFVLPA
ncbi:MAG TPA: GNAT family N-acetyltransferase [Trebonia sp.]|jgi:RimJ/RimL family protein N-acetyltransferase|nr:GNAT family N-acetyltransferase [Trebonia sp.]